MIKYLSGIFFILITTIQSAVCDNINLDYHLEIKPGFMHVSLAYTPVIAVSIHSSMEMNFMVG